MRFNFLLIDRSQIPHFVIIFSGCFLRYSVLSILLDKSSVFCSYLGRNESSPVSVRFPVGRLLFFENPAHFSSSYLFLCRLRIAAYIVVPLLNICFWSDPVAQWFGIPSAETFGVLSVELGYKSVSSQFIDGNKSRVAVSRILILLTYCASVSCSEIEMWFIRRPRDIPVTDFAFIIHREWRTNPRSQGSSLESPFRRWRRPFDYKSSQ